MGSLPINVAPFQMNLTLHIIKEKKALRSFFSSSLSRNSEFLTQLKNSNYAKLKITKKIA